MSRLIKRLTCGCCGAGFRRWTGYRDQDQDKGYGICQPCQVSIARDDCDAMSDAIGLLSNALNDANRTKFQASSRMHQELLVLQAFEDKILTWHIGR